MDTGFLQSLIGSAGTYIAPIAGMFQKTGTTPKNGFQSWLNAQTGAGLTGAQIVQNEFQERMANTMYQRQVADMEAAGINPALMYGSAPSSVSPSGSSPGSPTMDMSQLFAAVSLPLQLEQMKAQTKKILEETETEKIRREKLDTEISEVNQNIVSMMQKQLLDEANTAIANKSLAWLDRLNEANLNNINSQSALNKSTRNRIDKLLAGELTMQQYSLEDFFHKWDKIDAEIGEIADKRNLLKRDLEDYALNHMVSGLAGTGANVLNIMRAWLEDQREKNAE